MGNLTGSLTLFTSNILVCAALYLLRHSASDSTLRTVYLLAANAVAGVAGFLPFRRENSIRLDRPTLAVLAWSACYCAEYGLFVVYPGIITISQLIVCNSLAPFLAVYLSGDVHRSKLGAGYRLLSMAPILSLLSISYLEKHSNNTFHRNANLLLLCVLSSAVISQACARYVARNRSPSWSQPRLTILNAVFLALLVGCLSHSLTRVEGCSVSFEFIVVTGALVFAVQRFYVLGLKRADPFVSAVTLCSIVPLSLATEAVFEHRVIVRTELALAAVYMVATAATVLVTGKEPRKIG